MGPVLISVSSFADSPSSGGQAVWGQATVFGGWGAMAMIVGEPLADPK